MNKPNDFLAANLNAPENFTLSDFYVYGLTPDNTGLKDKDSYKNIKQVQNKFKKDNGEFDDAAFDAFYDSVSRSYNDWAQTDFAKNIMSSIPRSREDISDLNNTNIRNTDTELFSLADPWRHQRGMGNVYSIGKESFDIREVAQANNVRDAEGNKLDYTANDIGLFRNPFKSLFGTPLALAEDENGQPILDDEGNPFYRELKKGESTYGKQVLHIGDTLTKDDSWLNKFDFFDNDGLDKSVGGVIMNTASRVAPYLIPYVGPVLGAIDAVKGLATALPVLAKSVNGMITNENDNNSFGKAMNSMEAYMERFGYSKSRNAQDRNWAFENIGDMIATSAAQLFQQRTFAYIPWLLKMQDTEKATKIGQALSLGYMAATSAEDSLETFREAGLSDRAAGIATLAYATTLWRFMNKDYFKDQLFKGTWLNSSPEIRNILRQNNKEAARIAINSIQNAAKPNATKILTQEELKRESTNIFKEVSNALTQAWKTKSWSPIKGLDIIAPGSAFAEGNVYLNRALNEGLEEVMEEQLLDVLKVTSLGLESLGFNLKDETKEKLDFGLSVEDALQRYLTSFVGGAIGGAVFEGLDRYNTRILNKKTADYAGRGLNGQLIRAIRNYGSDRVLGELDNLWKAGKLGNKNLGVKGRFVVDPENKGKETFVFDEGTTNDNQNNLMRNLMAIRIKSIDSAMHNLGIYGKDNDIINGIVQEIEDEAKKSGISTEKYMQLNKRDVFSEFVQKTGFADIILNDIGNLEIDALEYDSKIEEERANILSKYTDADRAKADEEISKSKIIKEWTKKRDDALKLRDDIISGKATSQYIKYADFASHGSYVAKLLGKEDDPSVLDVASYTWAKYHVTYDSLSDTAKAAMDEDYADYQKLNGVDALYSANSLFQNVSNIVKPVIDSTANEFKGYHYATDLSESVVGDTVTDPDLIDPRILLNRTHRADYHPIVDKFLDPATVTPNSINKLLTSINNYYKYINDNKVIAEYGDDWVEYALSRLSDTLEEGFDVDALDAQFKQALESEQFKQNERISEDDPNFDEAFNYNTQYGVQEPLYDNAVKRALYINRLKSIIPNIISDPDTAIEQINDLRDVLGAEIRQDEVRENTVNTLTDSLSRIALRVKAINNAKSEVTHSPVIDLAKLISYELNGVEIPILDTIAKEKTSLVSKGTASEYMITSDANRVQLEYAKRLMPIIETVLDAALNGNRYTNQFLDESEALPVIDRGLYSLYVDDFHFLSNKIDYLLHLNSLNKNAKVREHINVRKYFYRNVIHRLLDNNTLDGEKNPTIDKLTKSMKGIDFANLWSQAGGDNLDLESDDPTVQVEVMKAFTTFEHLIRDHVRRNVTNYYELGTDIARAFDDSYKMKNGILSSNSNDDIDNFDLMTYLLTVVGTDSYEFGRKLKSKFEREDKFPFFGQELAIRFAYLGINNSDLINGAIDGISESTDDAVSTNVIKDVDENGKTLDEVAQSSIDYLSDRAKLWNTVIIDGFAGVGKSTVITKIALELSDNIEAIAVSKDLSRAQALGSQFAADSDHVFTLDQLLTNVLGKAYVESEWIGPYRDHSAKLKAISKPDAEVPYEPIETNASYKNARKDTNKRLVVVIDECTQLSEGEWQILVDAAKKEGVTIIGLGNTMQTGAMVEGDGQLNSVNLDDCVSLSTSKLTISMRTANAGKNENNIKVGALAKIAVDLQKDNPTHPIRVLSTDPKLNQEIKLEYDEETNSGDMIVSNITDETIDNLVAKLGPDENLVVITPNDDDFAASRAKYADVTTESGKPKVSFVQETLVGGSEYDYAIINIDFNDTLTNKLLDIKRFYTLMTRARKGSIIKNSNGLQNVLKVTSAPSPTASAQVVFDPDSEVAKQYKTTRLEALNAIPAEESVENPVAPEPEPAPEETVDEDDLSKNRDGSDKVTDEEILEEVDSDATEDIDDTDAPDDLTDYWITSGAVRGYKARQYIRRKSLLAKRQHNLVDADKFADWLADSKLELPYSPVATTNPASIETYKKHIKILSSIFLTSSTAAERTENFENRLRTLLNDRNVYNSDVSDSLYNAISRSTGVFFSQKLSDTEMLVYYCFADKYAIPITIINLSQNDINTERFYKDITFKQETGIIPISSNGRKRSKVSDTIGNFVEIVTDGENPITAIFTPKENLDVANNRRNKYFLDNRGHAYVGLSSASGLTSDEARAQWNPQTDDQGKIEYFLKDSEGSFAIAGVQEDIDAATFFKILETVRILTGSNVDSEGNDTNLQVVADFFNVDKSEVRNDFNVLLHNDPNLSAIENAKLFGKIRSKYNILYRREIELMTSAIIQYCVDHDQKALEYLTENLYTSLGSVYTNANRGDLIRTSGLRITAYDNKHRTRRFEIIPNSDLSEFSIFESTAEGVRLSSEKAIGTIKGDSFITDMRVDHRKLIAAAWEVIYDNSDLKSQTAFSKDLKQKTLSNDLIDSLIKSGTLSLSLTTESQTIGEDVIRYFSPFESKLLDLVSYPKSVGKTGRFLNDSDFMNVLKESSIFTYGIYRQISAKDDIGNNDVWRRGQVAFDKLTWDIVKVLAPVYDVTTTEITPDNDVNHSSGQYLGIYNALRTNETNDVSGTTVTQNGNKLIFDPQLNVDSNDPRWEKVFGKEVADAYTAEGYILTSITITPNNVTCQFKKRSGGHVSKSIKTEDIEILLEGITHDKINLSSVSNSRILATFNGVEFIGSEVAPKIKVGDVTEDIRRAELSVDNDEYVLYLYSNKLGETKVVLDGDYDGIAPFIDSLVTNYNRFGNYIGTTEDGYPIYYKSGVTATIRTEEADDTYFIKGVTDKSLLLMSDLGLVTEIPFTSMVNPNQIASLFNKAILSKGTGDPRLVKANGFIQVVGGTFNISNAILSEISDYPETTGNSELNLIDLNLNKITINGTQYNLNPNITEKTIDAWFENFYSKGDLNLALKTKIKNAFKDIADRLPGFDIFVETVSADNLEATINAYLNDHVLALDGFYKVSITANKSVFLTKDTSANAAVKLAILKANGGISINDIPETVVDSKNIWKSPEFSVTLLNNTTVSGTVVKIDNDWKVTFTTDSALSLDYLFNKLEQLKLNPEVSNQDIEYFQYRLNQMKNKTAPVTAYTIYGIQLLGRVKANPESEVARFYRELTNYNEKCSI